MQIMQIDVQSLLAQYVGIGMAFHFGRRRRVGKVFIFTLAMLALFSGSAAFAEQGCADGFIPNPVPGGAPGQNQCVPIPGQNRGGRNPSGSTDQWARRWGAFAMDSSGQLGVASGERSKGKAQKASIDDCRSRGGSDCKLMLAFYNQCGAAAWGPDDGGFSGFGSAATRKEAEAVAVQTCSKRSEKCEVFKSECSYGERVQ